MLWRTKSRQAPDQPSCKEDDHEKLKSIIQEALEINAYRDNCFCRIVAGDLAGAGQHD